MKIYVVYVKRVCIGMSFSKAEAESWIRGKEDKWKETYVETRDYRVF